MSISEIEFPKTIETRDYSSGPTWLSHVLNRNLRETTRADWISIHTYQAPCCPIFIQLRSDSSPSQKPALLKVRILQPYPYSVKRLHLLKSWLRICGFVVAMPAYEGDLNIILCHLAPQPLNLIVQNTYCEGWLYFLGPSLVRLWEHGKLLLLHISAVIKVLLHICVQVKTCQHSTLSSALSVNVMWW